MKIKYPLYLCCILFVLASCKKDKISVIQKASSPVQTAGGLSVSNVLQSNMVIQRNKPLLLSGFAPALDTVTVNVSWSNVLLRTKADASGSWHISTPVGGANSSPQSIKITSAGLPGIELSNILIGDVWVCSGQSNMVMQVDSIPPFQGVTNYKQEIAAADYPAIRAITVQPSYRNGPVDSLISPAQWVVCSPQTVGDISGVAYYFARKLNLSLNVPIGIIVSAVDGTYCEDWTSQLTFQNNPAIANYSNINAATQLYNGMISPFTRLSVTGFIWYQGENNKNDNPVSGYTTLNSDMIAGWRTAFNQPELPFYFVQMTPFAQDYFTTTPVGGNLASDSYAKFREAQANVLTVQNTGMAVTMDVGVPDDQHPPNKKPVGERLALLALKNNYGQNVPCYGPQYVAFSASSNTVTITFKAGTSTGLNTINNAPIKQYFYIAGNNHVFIQASAQINNDEIILTAPSSFALPVVAVRYAFTEAPVTNLQNAAGLPMEPFRTDSWDN